MTITSLDKAEVVGKKLTKAERILNFINSLFTATAQEEFYNTKEEQRDALLEVHKPVLEHYREFYSLLLLANINDLNKQVIIYNLLRTGKDIPKNHKHTENEIIFQALNSLPTQRAHKTFKMLRHLKINNARTRWLAEKFLTSRKNITLEVVKYKKTIKELVVHNHIHLEESEVFDFLFDKKDKYTTPLFNNYVKAKTDPTKLYLLPYSVAEGFSALHKVPRETFLKKIQSKMTQGEKLRMQNAAKKEGVKIVDADWTKFNLVQLFKFLRTQDKIPVKAKKTIEELAGKIAKDIIMGYSKVRLVLDNSASAYGSDEKKYHPVSVGQSISEVLSLKVEDYKEILVNGTRRGVLAPVGGSTNLAGAVIKALKDEPELLIIVSDGYENEPAGMTSQVLNAYKKVDKNMKVFHINPVFAAEKQTTRSLGDQIPVAGIRDAKQLQTSFFLLQARENLNKAIAEFQDYLVTKKKKIDLNNVKKYLE